MHDSMGHRRLSWISSRLEKTRARQDGRDFTNHMVIVSAASSADASTAALRSSRVRALGTSHGGAGHDKCGENAEELHIAEGLGIDLCCGM